MGSWNTQAASRRVTRTDACVTSQPFEPHQPAVPEDPDEPGGPECPPGACPYRSGRDQEFLHHRSHRSRQIDAGRPDAAVHRRGGRPPDAGAVPGPDGHRARARHHDQEPGGPAPVAGRGQETVRAQPHRHPRPRRLQLRGLPQPGRLRGRCAARRRRPGHRGADAGQPVPGAGRRPQDHPRAEQDRPAGRPARPLRRRTRRDHRLRPQRGPPGKRQDRGGRRAPAARDCPAGPGPVRPAGRPGPRAHLRLDLRHLPWRGHLRQGDGRQALQARAQPDDVHRLGARDARGGRDLAGTHAERRPGRRGGRIPDHRGQGRPPGPGRRHRDQRRPPGQGAARGLLHPEADGLLRPVPGGRRRLPRPARRAGQAAAERRRAAVRARDE